MKISNRLHNCLVLVLPAAILFSSLACAQENSIDWEYVMSQPWQVPAKLDSFVGVHPRYLLNDAKIVQLKSKIDTSHKKLWLMVEQRANSYHTKAPPVEFNKQQPMRYAGRDIPFMALAFLLTDDTRHLINAKRWMFSLCSYPTWDGDASLGAAECLLGVAIGYDWLYDEFTERERDFVRAKLVYQAERMKNAPPQHHDRWLANHNNMEYAGLAAAGFVLYGQVPQAKQWLRQSGLNMQKVFELLGPDGASDEGHQYWAYSTGALLCYAEAARDLMGINYYDSSFFKNASDFIIYSTTPQLEPDSYVMGYGDTERNYGSRNPLAILCRLASEYDNGFAQQMADLMVARAIGANDYNTWRALLWYDENVTPLSLSKLPRLKHFENIGWVTARSDWRADAVMVGFKCGPFHGHKLQPLYEKMADGKWPVQLLSGGHCHPDINSFQIYAYGKWLAIDPNYERPKWTKTHNTILVDGVGQLGESIGRSEKYRWFDRESVIKAKAKSKILKCENRPDYDYIVGDAGNIYPASTGLKKFRRHLLFIKPDVIVIVDELEATRAVQFEWRLHAAEAIEKIKADCYLVKSDDVVMDTHIAHPATVETVVDGRFLRVLPSKAKQAIIVTCLHPRKAANKPSKIKSCEVKGETVQLYLETEKRDIGMRINLRSRRVMIER